MENQVFIIIVSLFFSAFFSGIEIAYISMNRLKVELLKNQGSFTGNILAGFAGNSSRFLGMTLLGNNIALIVLGIASAKLMEPFLGNLFARLINPTGDFQAAILITQTLLTTLLVLTFGEFLPKALFRVNPTGILQFFALPLKIVDIVLWLPVKLIVLITDFILHNLMGIEVSQQKPIYSKVDLEEFVNQFVKNEEREEEDIDTEIFERALSLTDVKVRECMIPRTEIVAVEINDSIPDLLKLILESKHSKIIVYEDTIDTIKGYVHHFDLMKKPATIAEIIFPIKVIPESMGARNLLNMFIKDHNSIAWVVDEFGGTAGIVTLEDILEEVFGEIQDEHDSEDFIERQISGNEYIFSGRLEVDYLNEKYALNLPEGEYETLAGFIVSRHESIPQQDEIILVNQFEFKTIGVSDTRIETVKLTVLSEGE